MQLFKSKTFKRIFALVTLVLLLGFTYRFITDEFNNVTFGIYMEEELKKIRESGEEVDLIFFGSSRVYQSFMPSIFEEKLGYENVILGATASQPICGSYYYMKELIEQFHPKKVVLNVTFDGLLNEEILQTRLLIYDRLSLKNKIPFVLNCIDESDRKYILGPCRFRDNILMYDMIKAEREELEANLSGIYYPGKDYFADKGFMYTQRSYETGTIPYGYGITYKFSENDILEENLLYLDKCVELCQENDVELALVTAPTALAYMYQVEGYDDAVEWYKAYAKKNGLTYYNLNYLRDREIIMPDKYMYDMCHTNGEGAKIVSNLYAEILMKERNGEDVSEYFYDNFDELKKDVHRITAVSANITMSQEVIDSMVVANISMQSLQNEDVKPLYQIERIDSTGNVSVLVEWTHDTEKEILLPQGTNYCIKVRAKTGVEGDAEAVQSYYY